MFQLDWLNHHLAPFQNVPMGIVKGFGNTQWSWVTQDTTGWKNKPVVKITNCQTFKKDPKHNDSETWNVQNPQQQEQTIRDKPRQRSFLQNLECFFPRAWYVLLTFLHVSCCLISFSLGATNDDDTATTTSSAGVWLEGTCVCLVKVRVAQVMEN